TTRGEKALAHAPSSVSNVRLVRRTPMANWFGLAAFHLVRSLGWKSGLRADVQQPIDAETRIEALHFRPEFVRGFRRSLRRIGILHVFLHERQNGSVIRRARDLVARD